MKIFFTSDLHFSHKNAIGFDQRPYFTVSEMNEDLIQRWNVKVGKGDLVYVLGDMFWQNDCEFIQNTLKRLNGQIVLIKGNHDRWLHNAENKKLLAGVKDYDDIKVTLKDGTIKRCILSHYPIHFYNAHYYGAIMLYGHVHDTKEYALTKEVTELMNKRDCPVEMYNVFCGLYDYTPVTLDEILERNRE